jgi:transcription initiation factor TFIIIB Brf1 subunit/transcription initiation factor TFIIB
MVDTLTKDYTQHVGDYSHKTSNVYKLAAELYLHEHQNDKAITLLKRALNIETKLFGVSHSRTKKTQAALAILTRSRDTNAKSS